LRSSIPRRAKALSRLGQFDVGSGDLGKAQKLEHLGEL
jgi:hypothetical protein